MDTDAKSKSDPKEGELFLAEVAKKRYKDAGTSELLPKVSKNKKDGKEMNQLETTVRFFFPITNQYWTNIGYILAKYWHEMLLNIGVFVF